MSDPIRLRDFDDPTFDVSMADEEVWGDIANPWPRFREYRQNSPLASGEYRVLFGSTPDPAIAHLPQFSAFGYAEVEAVFTDAGTYSNSVHALNSGRAFGRMLLVMDPPEHTRYRKVLQKAFSPKTIQRWTETLILPVIHGLIDEIADSRGCDLVQAFTKSYPFVAVYRLLGLPETDVKIFHKLAMAQILTPLYPKEATEAGAKLGEYFAALIAERRHSPGADFISDMINTEVDGERLPEANAIAFLRHILNAAGDTTFRTTGSLLTALLSDQAQMDAIRKDRGLIPAAIEEALRWDGPVVATLRMTTREVSLGGVTMPASSVVHVVQGSANHDDDRFPDPERFDLFRERRHRNFAFGSGVHVCLGMHLAKLQIREAMNALLDRLPNLRLDPEHPKPMVRGMSLRAPREIHVLFG